jgi:hypothetical protein
MHFLFAFSSPIVGTYFYQCEVCDFFFFSLYLMQTHANIFCAVLSVFLSELKRVTHHCQTPSPKTDFAADPILLVCVMLLNILQISTNSNFLH